MRNSSGQISSSPNFKRAKTALLLTTALGAAGFAGAAFAQAKPNANALEEVVVTATRQNSTVNKVALSVSAVTQKSLDQQGIRSVQDLSNQVPGFTFRTSGADNNPQLTIRGIGGNAIGGTSGSAATTGVYIDDVSMQKRNVNSLETGSGSPVPLLYDLDRVEVLRGPQGTLYGGSSEGGTLRFITPQPSLTTYSGTARIGVNQVNNGGMGNEEGFALGGPLVKDKLGFRFSGFRQDRGGWTNGYSEYDGHQFASQENKGNDYSLRAALTWQINPDFKANLSVMNQMNYDQDTSVVRTTSPAVSIALRTFNNTGTINGVKFSFPATVFGGYTIPAQTWFANNNGNSTSGLYLTPTDVQYQPSPRRTIFTTPSLTLDYNWRDKINFKSISAYTSDMTGGWTFGGGGGLRTSNMPSLTNQPCPTGPGASVPILTNGPNSCTIAAQFLQLAPNFQPMGVGQQNLQVPGPANVFGRFMFNNRRGQVTQEFRVSTIDPSQRLQFVAGLFIEHENNHVNNGSNWNENIINGAVRGTNEAYYAGGEAQVPVQQKPFNNVIDVATRNINITEDEQSLFGEASFAVTSKLKIVAGVRVTNYQQIYQQIYGGSVAGTPTATDATGKPISFVGSSDTGAIETSITSLTPFPTNFGACPVNIKDGFDNSAKYAIAGCPYQYDYVVLKEHPVTPKIGATYNLTASDLLYVTYSEGQRPGGVNPPIPPVQCSQDLANLGGKPPLTYQHDQVKSTELGGKFRLFDGQMQLNASAFHIAWNNVQFVVPFVFCSITFVANAAQATSDGAEIQASGRMWGFTLNGNIGYDKAQYASNVLGPANPTTGARALLALKGDNLGVPDWTANVGLQYDWHTFDMPTYLRMDYSYTGKYARITGPGTNSFVAAVAPNYVNGNETHLLNGRAGIYWKDMEVAIYAKNIGNSKEWINLTQGTGNYYQTGTTFQPRLIGMQVNYRF